MNILVTGGAGFIGSHVASELLQRGHRVRALDSLIPQVHGADGQRPAYLDPDVELMIGDVRDENACRRALENMDAAIHLAARVGVGQSMYEMAEYTSVNNSGTAVFLEALSSHPVNVLVVASSMSIYGEGLYRNASGKVCAPCGRSLEQLRMSIWEVRDASGNVLTPVPTPETKLPALASVYALSKYDQERMSLIVGGAYGIPVVALRLFNTYGPHQALSNPYTGVLSNFASRILNGHVPLIYEDGLQKRDFVSIYDVARAFRLALETPAAAGREFNISSGKAIPVKDAAALTAKAMGREDLKPEITGRYRSGDIRHCFADIRRAREILGWEPQISLEAGVTDLANWLEGKTAMDRAIEARAELAARGLMV